MFLFLHQHMESDSFDEDRCNVLVCGASEDG